MRTVLFFLILAQASAQNVVFLEPAGKIDTRGSDIAAEMPLFRKAAPDKFLPWLKNDSAQFALGLYQRAFRLLEERGNTQRQPRDYYIALVPGGNHASVGFRIDTGSGIEEHPKHAYILLDAQPYRFESTLLHETGHVAMEMLAGGRQLPSAHVASIPHSTASLTDRATAFSEGWAIHLETLAAHYAADVNGRRRFHREMVLFGDGQYQALEYFRHSVDLMSYSQNVARYLDVRDNNFAFESAYRGPDYLRVQLEKARDFASLRDANQLLQSEGFHASFFFLFEMRGDGKPAQEVVIARQDHLLRAMASMFADTKAEPDTPWLLHVVTHYAQMFADEKTAIFDALNDLSHGVFVDANAASLWRDHYLAALRLDMKNIKGEQIQAARKRWREQTSADPKILFSRLGPQLGCEVKSVQVGLAAFGRTSPLQFDINTVQEGVLHMVPGLTGEQIQAWLSARPFGSMEEFGKKLPEVKACSPGS